MKIEHKTVATSHGDVDIYKITNASGASVELSSVGAGILAVNVPDCHGRIENVCLGYNDIESYFHDGPCMGKTPGRYANRIGAGRFSVDGKEYKLAINNGPNALHGGPEGFQNHIWESRVEGDNTVVFTRVSPDGEEGYPGNLTARVTYTWSEDNVLSINYHATTDAPTVVNLTNHTYWNLRAENAGCAFAHCLRLDADHYLPTDEYLLPTGDIACVKSTPMDFTTLRPIGDDIRKPFPAIEYGKGYDSSWLINEYTPGVMHHAATLICPVTGRQLDVFTDQPAVQVYSGNWLRGCPTARSGHDYDDYDGIAIECQDCPDAPNRPEFPSAELRPGQTYNRNIRFALTLEGDF